MVWPGIGIQLTRGKYAGRLVFPIYYNNRERGQCLAVIIATIMVRRKRGQSLMMVEVGDKIIDSKSLVSLKLN